MEIGYSRNMGLWIEIREKATCYDNFCVARVVLESTLERVGYIGLQLFEEHVERLGKLISDDSYIMDDNGYTFTVEEKLKITIYDVEFDIVECGLEGCTGYITASVLVEGDSAVMREIAKKMAKDMGIDKYL
jgi:hypothetical protein